MTESQVCLDSLVYSLMIATLIFLTIVNVVTLVRDLKERYE